MKSVDLSRVRDLSGNIADAVRRLTELSQLTESDFVNDFRNSESAKYLLIVAAEAAIDLCNHIVARSGGRAPQDYADCFEVSRDLSVITPDLATRLKQLARFRNLLVHLYWQVDNQRVYQFLQNDLNDLDLYLQQVHAWLGL